MCGSVGAFFGGVLLVAVIALVVFGFLGAKYQEWFQRICPIKVGSKKPDEAIVSAGGYSPYY